MYPIFVILQWTIQNVLDYFINIFLQLMLSPSLPLSSIGILCVIVAQSLETFFWGDLKVGFKTLISVKYIFDLVLEVLQI